MNATSRRRRHARVSVLRRSSRWKTSWTVAARGVLSAIASFVLEGGFMRLKISVVAFLAILQGCTGTMDTDAGDASHEASTSDVRSEGGNDTGTDVVSTDVAHDTGPDTVTVDVPTDTGEDVAADEGADTGSDVVTADTGDDVTITDSDVDARSDVVADDAVDVASDDGAIDSGDTGVDRCAGWLDAPVVPTPPGTVSMPVVYHAAASGTQNYRCTATTSGGATTYAWAAAGPDAVLTDCNGATVGHHMASAAGPTAPQWVLDDGSAVVGARDSGATVDPTAVPWLLLHATSTSGVGAMTNVRYIHRVNTVGGLAPATGCDATHEGEISRVMYTADYYFYAPDTTCIGWNDAPTVDPSIAIPASAGPLVVVAHTAAAGTQNYACQATTSGGATTYAWAPAGPDAVLSDCTGATVGHHMASSGGPTAPQWQHNDGSLVIGSRMAGHSVDATAVPWLLLNATSTSGSGTFSNVRFIHRVNTVGGLAPTTGCDATHVGDTTMVSYTADYYFYAPDALCAGWNTAPLTDATLRPTAGSRVILHAGANGTQNYACQATTSGGTTTYAWTLTGPDAVLTDCTGATIGHHMASAGGATAPQWMHNDGSLVIGARAAAVPVDATSIPWLLLNATSTSGTGVLTPTTQIQRVNTTGGHAPATGCDSTHVGDTTTVGYTADYYFFGP